MLRTHTHIVTDCWLNINLRPAVALSVHERISQSQQRTASMLSWWSGPWKQYEKWGKSVTPTLNVPDRQTSHGGSPVTPLWHKIAIYMLLHWRLFQGNRAIGEIVKSKKFWFLRIWLSKLHYDELASWTFCISHWMDVDSCTHTHLLFIISTTTAMFPNSHSVLWRLLPVSCFFLEGTHCLAIVLWLKTLWQWHFG